MHMQLTQLIDERVDECHQKLKTYLLIAIDSDPYIVKKLETHFSELEEYFFEIYEHAVKAFIKLFKEKGWYKSDFFKYIPRKQLLRILNKISVYDIVFLCNKNESFLKYIPVGYKMINYVTKYLHFHNIVGLDKTFGDLKSYTEFNTFCLKEYLKGNEPELPSHITKEIIMELLLTIMCEHKYYMDK